MSVEYTPTMKVPERPVWLTDHPGATLCIAASNAAQLIWTGSTASGSCG